MRGSVNQRLLVVTKDADCAPCPLRGACLGRTASGTRGRRVSAARHRRITGGVLRPRPVGAVAAVKWNDVAGRQLRRAWMAHWRQQTVTVASLPASVSPPPRPPRAARSHRRLSWLERLGGTARGPLLVTSIRVSGVMPAGPQSPPAPYVIPSRSAWPWRATRLASPFRKAGGLSRFAR
jgi:hypothetical protein